MGWPFTNRLKRNPPWQPADPRNDVLEADSAPDDPPIQSS